MLARRRQGLAVGMETAFWTKELMVFSLVVGKGEAVGVPRCRLDKCLDKNEGVIGGPLAVGRIVVGTGLATKGKDVGFHL